MKTDGCGNPLRDEEVYVIQNADAAGDAVLWWRPNSAGYTVDVEEAGCYSADFVRRETLSSGRDVAWKRIDVLPLGRRVVSHVKLMEMMRATGRHQRNDPA